MIFSDNKDHPQEALNDLGNVAVKAMAYDQAGEKLTEKLENALGVQTKAERIKNEKAASDLHRGR